MVARGVLVFAILAVATGVGLWWAVRNGRFAAAPSAHGGTVPRVTTAELGTALGTELTFLQLSSESCAACRRAGVVLSRLVAERPGLAHVELGVTGHLDLVRRFGVMRTPTVLVLDADGVVAGRMSGALDHRRAVAALESCRATVRSR